MDKLLGACSALCSHVLVVFLGSLRASLCFPPHALYDASPNHWFLIDLDTMQGTRIFLLAFVVLAFASCSVASSETVHKFPKYMLVAVEKVRLPLINARAWPLPPPWFERRLTQNDHIVALIQSSHHAFSFVFMSSVSMMVAVFGYSMADGRMEMTSSLQRMGERLSQIQRKSQMVTIRYVDLFSACRLLSIAYRLRLPLQHGFPLTVSLQHESGMDDKTAYEYVARFKSVIKVEDKKHILAKVGGNTALWASFNTGKVETSGMGHDWLFVHELSKHGGQFEPPDSYLFAVWSAYAAYVLPEIINKKGCNGAKGLSAAIKSPKAGQRCSVCVELSPTGSKVPNHISIALTDLKDCGKGGGSFIETVPSTPSHSLSSTISSSIPSPSSTSYPQAYRSKLGYKSDQGILSEVQPHSHPIIV